MPFISIEGIDGSGKSEQVKRLVEHLRALGHLVLQTKEPDGGHLGSEVRAILTHSDRDLAPAEQLLLVSAARYDHVKNVIRPALASGEWVISDRFVDSTYAFQVAVSDVDLHQLFRSVADVVVGTTLPNFTFILDLPLEVARARRDQRHDGINDPAEATRDFAAIRDGLLEVAIKNPERCHIIDADQQPGEVARDIWRIVERVLRDSPATQ
ncbi:dTMP kinase [Pseudomonas sp. CBSPBW29]|uniref:dTMP kinase n=1 Tax=Pseudomonas TaxID=286 RepID=UPI0021ACAF22|nr:MULTISPECIES: dTMP kinase [unclassified Pseudomonas]WEL44505.1 dTMP kinase [Pseudomonas sp. CBSPBW29]WEL65593.1 dTMP kinase [Pseudomonas sp. CBSPGW29]WEL69061.1 dTMP kinase [Pseudomonas sp. CBSPCGW29]WEL76060.1 dTMP kinase [Pseudomonas sp. CBSPAW29]WEL85367.1 dTMP kinase [Pseudomonas sp. CBSPCAW29]WEL88156.1 dTMP kinase [Pseudomonas sp. CBSPCBW29]